MNNSPIPPKGLIKTLVPILARVVGALFILSGIVSLALGIRLSVAEVQGSGAPHLHLIAKGILSLCVGACVVKFMPRFLLSRIEKLKESGIF